MAEPTKIPPDDLVTTLIGGLQAVFQSVQSMASTGAQQVRQSVFPSGTGFNGVYGFTLRADLGKPCITVEPFGNVQADATTGQPVILDHLEPPTEILEDVAVFVITAEMPGVGAGDVQVEVKDRTLVISAAKGRRKYRKELSLPAGCSTEILSRTCQEGVLEVRVAKV
jgi:HSP20 family protein